MRKVKKWRYYCDFCKKGGCSSSRMTAHEKHCCDNPSRLCRMCAHATGEPDQIMPEPIDTLIAAFESGGLDELRNVAIGCPACMLAAVKQSRKRRGVTPGDPDEEWFDYAKERERMWQERNDELMGRA